MQLLKASLVYLLCFVYAAAREVCLWEEVNASCAAGEVFFIESAVYGRIHNSRCYNSTENEPNCTTDIRYAVQTQYGLKQDIQLRVVSNFFTTKRPACLDTRIPLSLDISYYCTKLTFDDICIEETFEAICPSGTAIVIQSALYGRMRSSRCIDFENRELNCFANVQPFLEGLCNGRIGCSIKASDDRFKKVVGSCKQSQKPYLEVFYTCVQAFSCPSFSPPKDATMHKLHDGYDVMCENNKSTTHKLRCSDGKWNMDPAQLCRKDLDMLEPLIFFGAGAVFMLFAIIAVVVCLKRIRMKSNARSIRHRQTVPPVSPRPTQRSIRIYEPPSKKTCRLPPEPHTYMELLPENQPKVGAYSP